MSLLLRAKRPAGRPLDIAVVDYGMGNLGSVRHALDFLGHRARATDDPAELAAADAIVLPGVGAFSLAMDNLAKRGQAAALEAAVMRRGIPFLGICLGMQMLAREGTENGVHAGLGWIDARIEKLAGGAGRRVPHVGWAPIAGNDDVVTAGIAPDECFYFDHSYHAVCAPNVATMACAGAFDCVAAFRKDHVFGVQFHPEKSQRAGLRLLRNFTDYCLARRDGGPEQ